MAIAEEESRHLTLSLSDVDQLCPVAKALSSPIRVKMLQLLHNRAMNVGELADALNLPVSTAALNIRQLEDSGLITTVIQPGIRGAMKLCARRVESVSVLLSPAPQTENSALELSLPIGSYSSAEGIQPECGLVSDHAWIGESNMPHAFYHPDRFGAQMLWFHSGFLEYRLSLGEIRPDQVEWIEFSMELSSNAPLYRPDFKSDISVMVNGQSLGTWTSPGDYGSRRGRLNPSWWSSTSSQYGLLKTWRVDAMGSHLDGVCSSATTLRDLCLEESEFISLRVGVSADAEHVGGLNLFGERFGDCAQDIIMRVGYVNKD